MVLLFSDHLRYMKNLNIGFFHISSFWHIRKLNVCGEKLFFYVICMKVFWISGTGKTPKWKRMRFELLISCKKIRWCYICEQHVTNMKFFWLICFVGTVLFIVMTLSYLKNEIQTLEDFSLVDTVWFLYLDGRIMSGEIKRIFIDPTYSLICEII